MKEKIVMGSHAGMSGVPKKTSTCERAAESCRMTILRTEELEYSYG